MPRAASITKVLRAHRQKAVALAIGVAITAGGSTALLTTTNSMHAQASAHHINDAALVLRADRSGKPAEAADAVRLARSPVTAQPWSYTLRDDAPLVGLVNGQRVGAIANPEAVREHARLSDAKITDLEGERPRLVVVEQPPPPPPPVVPSPAPPMTQLPWGSTDLGQKILAYRTKHNISSQRNVAVFEYLDVRKLPNGRYQATNTSGETKIFQNGSDAQRQAQLKTVTLASKRGEGHAERLVAKELQKLGVAPEDVRRIHSELEPCGEIPGGYCKRMIVEGSPETNRNPALGPFPNASVTYNFPYDFPTPEERALAARELEDTVDVWKRIRGEAGALLQTPQQAPAMGALANMLSQPPAASPGGIDFSSLELRYLADSGLGDSQGLRYAFTALPTTEDQDPTVGLQAAQQASDAFFVWLGLPTSKFWVNLNPNEPDRIVDAQLGRTNVGRVLLEADLQMKKTIAQLIHPDTPLGAQFWAALDMDGTSGGCLSFRQWIVPAPATIRNDSKALYILDAPLLVQLESEYIALRDDNNHPMSCAPQQESVEQHNEAVFRSMILPRVQQAVNEAPEYAELRRVYLSRVAAEWYRQQSAHTDMTFTGLIDSGDITPWVSRQPWSPQDVFNRYVQSYTNGEFNVTRQAQQGNLIETNTYIFGGVDFTSIPFHSLSAGDFQSEWSDLSNTVEQAFDHPTPDEKGKVWLGSMSGTGSQHGSKIDLSGYLFFTVIGIAAAVSTRSWWRLRRARRDWARASPSAPSR